MGFLNKKIIDFSKESFFGIDMGDSSIKAIQISRDTENMKLNGFSYVELPPGIIVEGEVRKEDILAQKIKELYGKAQPKGFKTRKVVCSIPEGKAFLRLITMPKMNEAEVGDAIKWEIEANIPLGLDDVYYDWQLLRDGFGGIQDKNTVLIVAVARETVDGFLSVMEKAGLEVIGAEVESAAQARSLLEAGEKNKTNVIIDIGKHKTGFIVIYDGAPCFTSSFPVSTTAFIDAVSKNFNMGREEAENILMKDGIGSFLKKDPVFKAVNPVLENLVSEIEKSIEFYLSSLGYSNQVDELIVCGGGGSIKGLIPYVSKRLDQEVKIGNPWINLRLKKEIPILSKEISLQYSTAIGLALKKIKSEFE